MSTQKLIARRRGASGGSNMDAEEAAAGADAADAGAQAAPSHDNDAAETPAKNDAGAADCTATAATNASDDTPDADNRRKAQEADTPEAANLSAKAETAKETGDGNGVEPMAASGTGGVADSAPASAIETKKAESESNKPNTRMRTRSLSSARSSPSKGSAARSQADDNDHETGSNPHRTRSRTRSLSSALSSISGGDSAGDRAEAPPDDDGKTPLRANRGPVRKRHKKKGPRALFQSDTVGGDPLLPPLEHDAGAAGTVTFASGTRRTRSDTLDSFRAAMDDRPSAGLLPAAADLPGESILLPERKDAEGKAGEKVDDILGSPRSGSLGSPRPDAQTSPRRRSDTLDFLASALGDGAAAPSVDDLHPVGGKKLEPRRGGRRRTPTKKNAEVDHGKTPKIANRARGGSQSSESGAGPLRKRHRARSLSFADEKTDNSGKGAREDDAATHGSEKSNSTGGRRSRSNTLDYDAFDGPRTRSDTLDFLTAAVAGDTNHDLDAAVALAAADGASFAVHRISAPSGASAHYKPMPPPRQRPRSDTLDSTTSSINSAKLDFLVSVAAEHGPLPTSPVASGAAGQRRERTDSNVGSDASSLERPRRRPRSNTLEIYSTMAAGARTRSDTVDFLMGAQHDHPMADLDGAVLPGVHGEEGASGSGNVMDHLEALCAEPRVDDDGRASRRKRRSSSADKGKSEEGGSAASQSNNSKRRKASEATWKESLSQEQSFMDNLTRNRLESWGGMSDLSGAGAGGALAATHTALRDTGLLDDVLAAAADLGGDDLSSAGGSGFERRMRRMRAASGGSNSMSGLVTGTAKGGRPRKDSLASLSLASLSDASISVPKDQSKAKAEAKTPAAKKAAEKAKGRGAAVAARRTTAAKPPSDVASASTPSIVVDYDAIASAVHAANAATEGLDLATILGTSTVGSKASADSGLKAGKASLAQKQKTKAASASARSAPTAQAKAPAASAKKPSPVQQKMANGSMPEAVGSGGKAAPQAKAPPAPFPVTSINIPFVPIPKSTKTEAEMDAIRERARAAAGYVPPGQEGKARRPPPPPPSSAGAPRPGQPPPSYRPRPGAPPSHIPIKKRGVLPLPPGQHPRAMPDRVQSHAGPPPPYVRRPAPVSSSTYTPKSGTLQSQQKWDDMFGCLVKFIEETREKATKNMTEQQKSQWIWDGNVPTSYKTPDGKALGRWINNQRSAKGKGTLKDDREVRLVSTGLKWCVLTTNSWKQMLQELESYVREQTKGGRVWDGNVPTNYKIATASGSADDEGKNLGRWVNRQRSLFQAGKLKKERQEDLERIGLKWSVLLTTPWATMYESLCAYAEERKRQSPHGRWDGNVPATFKTKSTPPLSLGRWVNRQRSAYAKGRLKEEHVKKLEEVGLKWAINSRPALNGANVREGAIQPVALASSTVALNQSASVPSASAQKTSVQAVAVAPPLPPLPVPSSVQTSVDTQ